MGRLKAYIIAFFNNAQPKGERGFVVFDNVRKFPEGGDKAQLEIGPVIAGVKNGPMHSITGYRMNRPVSLTFTPEILDEFVEWANSPDGKKYRKAMAEAKKDHSNEKLRY